MKGICASIFLSVSIAFVPAGHAETGGFPRIVMDDTGGKVEVQRKPARIVSVALPVDEILLSLVDRDRMIGVSRFSTDSKISNVASSAARVPNKVTLDVEYLISLRPDLVFVADWSRPESVAQLRAAGVSVYQYASPSTVREIEEGISRMGAAVGEEAKAAELAGWMRSRLDLVRSKTAGIPEARRASVLDYEAWGASMGKGTSWDEIVRLAGCRNAAADLEADRLGQVPVSKEKLLDLDPDILLLPGWVYGSPEGSDRLLRSVLSDPVLGNMRAVREGRVYRMAENLKSCTSQYIVLGVEELARLAYPRLFGRGSG